MSWLNHLMISLGALVASIFGGHQGIPSVIVSTSTVQEQTNSISTSTISLNPIWKTYTQKNNVYSFNYPAGYIDPNVFVYIDSTNGAILPIPAGQSPQKFQDMRDKKPSYQGAVSLTLNDDTNKTLAKLTFVMAADERFTTLLQKAGSKPISVGKVDGLLLVKYVPPTQQSEGVAVYRLSLGQYKQATGENIDESLLILAEHVGSSPSMSKNFQTIEQVLQTVTPNISVISKIILNNGK